MPTIDAAYAERMEDVLATLRTALQSHRTGGLSRRKAVVLHQDKRTGTAAAPGKPAKRDYEYKRRGTANVFCTVEHWLVATSLGPLPNRSGPEFAKAMQRLADSYPAARTIHLVLDNLSTHSFRSLCRHFGDQQAEALWQRFTIHHTPKHASWLNQAEIEISLFRRQCLGSRRIATLREPRSESRAWNKLINRRRLKINWTFSRIDADNVFHGQLKLFKRSQH